MDKNQPINIKLRLDEPEENLKLKIKKKLGRQVSYHIVNKSIDARDKENITINYFIRLGPPPKYSPPPRTQIGKGRHVVVVGSGPSGLFCALSLSRNGFLVTVVERGDSVENRKDKIKQFEKTKILDANTNVQFGEGGAGTFSDGKLNTRTNDGKISTVIEEFILHGAPEEIRYTTKPHIGSDNLPKVVKNMREEIISGGGTFLFCEQVVDIITDGDQVKTVVTDKRKIDCDEVVLAIGHSARDTFKMLHQRGVSMESKEFAVGFRIEHLQEDIAQSQYGKNYLNPLLPTADYRLVSNANGRGVFTFCMCPGGYVMPATSMQNGVVTNGMSEFLRDGKNANSAVVTQVRKEDFGYNLFDGMEFQERIERLSYDLGGGNYTAPISLVKDFFTDTVSCKLGKITPTYPLGYTFAPIGKILPTSLTEAIKFGISDMDKRLKGFAHSDAILTAVESRTSSPIRIVRGQNLSSISFINLYPAGEGAGYAGGITSSAVDGLRVAEQIINKHSLF